MNFITVNDSDGNDHLINLDNVVLINMNYTHYRYGEKAATNGVRFVLTSMNGSLDPTGEGEFSADVIHCFGEQAEYLRRLFKDSYGYKVSGKNGKIDQ